MKVLGQGFENALELLKDNADILKVVQCFGWSNTLFLL